LAISDAESVVRARQVLDRAGYTKGNIGNSLGLDAFGAPLRAANLARLAHRCGGSALETLIRLFILGQPVDVDVVRRALAPMTLEEWQALGLLQAGDGQASALYELHAGDSLILALPTPSTRRPPSRETLELHAELRSPRTWLLDDLTIRRPARGTLAIAAGCGIHALLAASHSTEVLAVDRNPRAAELAAFNARLNNLRQVECRPGEVTEAADERTFDLIVGNPSVAVAPPPMTGGRARDLPGDSSYEEFVRSLPRLLQPGGHAQILIHWAHRRGDDGQERLRSWVAGSGCDAWVMRLATQDPAGYALEWLPEPPDENLEPFQRRLDAWMVYYAQQGITAISTGLITMHARPSSTSWFVCEDAPELLGACGEALLRGCRNRTFLAKVAGDQALLDTRLRVVPEARWEQQSSLGAESWSVMSSQLHLSGGLGRTLQVDGNVMAFLSRCRGQQTLRDVLTDLAAALKQEPGSMTAEGIELARVLLEQGFVVAMEE
jgi:hypothetical protein